MIFFYKNFYPSLYYKTLLIAVQIFNVKDLRIMAIVNTDGHIYIYTLSTLFVVHDVTS